MSLLWGGTQRRRKMEKVWNSLCSSFVPVARVRASFLLVLDHWKPCVCVRVRRAMLLDTDYNHRDHVELIAAQPIDQPLPGLGVPPRKVAGSDGTMSPVGVTMNAGKPKPTCDEADTLPRVLPALARLNRLTESREAAPWRSPRGDRSGWPWWE